MSVYFLDFSLSIVGLHLMNFIFSLDYSENLQSLLSSLTRNERKRITKKKKALINVI